MTAVPFFLWRTFRHFHTHKCMGAETLYILHLFIYERERIFTKFTCWIYERQEQVARDPVRMRTPSSSLSLSPSLLWVPFSTVQPLGLWKFYPSKWKYYIDVFHDRTNRLLFYLPVFRSLPFRLGNSCCICTFGVDRIYICFTYGNGSKFTLYFILMEIFCRVENLFPMNVS